MFIIMERPSVAILHVNKQIECVRLVSPQQILTIVMTCIVVRDKSTDNAKPHSICFLLQYQRQRSVFFFRARGRARA